MDVQLDLPECKLSTEEKALVSGLNQFLEWLPARDDPDVALRLAVCRRSLLLQKPNKVNYGNKSKK